MYSVNPNNDQFYLRLLLLHQKGATSHDDLKTVDGDKCSTFQEAARKSGLLKEDTEWEKCLSEAASYQMPSQLRQLFATILDLGQPSDPKQLWEMFKLDLAEDYIHKKESEDRAIQLAYWEVNQKLMENGKDVAKCHLEISGLEALPPVESEDSTAEKDLAEGEDMYEKLNSSQRAFADDVLEAIDRKSDKNCFFVDGPGGTGKTFVFTALYR